MKTFVVFTILAISYGWGSTTRPNKAKQEPITVEEREAFFKTKDCSSYKPNRRIQCDISLYDAGLITKDAAIADITTALVEWKKEGGDSDSLYYIGFDIKNFALAIGHAELLVSTWQYYFPITFPKWSETKYISHYMTHTKPVITYSFSSITGEDVVDHWIEYLAPEGIGSRNLLFVQGGSSKTDHGKSCEAFNKLPRSVRERRSITVILEEPKMCATIPDSYEVIVGRYKKMHQTDKRSYTTYTPVWECVRAEKDWDCYGEIDSEDYQKLEKHFLA